MAQPYAWRRIDKSDGSATISARSGHTIAYVKDGLICYGGTDGRKNERGSAVPNSDMYLLSLTSDNYSWSFLSATDSSSLSCPPARANHSMVALDGDKV